MKDPTADDSAKISNTPINRITKINGNSHHFLRSFRNVNKSVKNSIYFLFNPVQTLLSTCPSESTLVVFSSQKYNYLTQGNPSQYA